MLKEVEEIFQEVEEVEKDLKEVPSPQEEVEGKNLKSFYDCEKINKNLQRFLFVLCLNLV